MNAKFTRTSISGAPHEWRRAFHRGWVDYQNGAPFDRQYDRMSMREQIGYETGRLVVCGLIAGGFAVPLWRGDKAGSRSVERSFAPLRHDWPIPRGAAAMEREA